MRSTLRTTAIASALLAVLVSAAHAGAAAPPAFPDSLLARWAGYQRVAHVPGLAVVLVRDTGVVAMATLGERDAETHRPVGRDTRFYVASCTKTFLATALASLAADGGIDLDAPVKGMLANFRLGDAAATESLTTRELLAHRRGLTQPAIGLLTAYTGQMTEARWQWWLPRVSAQNTFAYSNLNYQLAARVLEARTGATWQQAVRERVFVPLGMTRGAVTAAELTRDPDVARPSAWRDGRLATVAAKSDHTLHAAGGTGASIGDLARWLRAQLGDGRLDGRQALPEAVVRGMRRIEVPLDDRHPMRSDQRRAGWTAGWEVRTIGGDTMYVHTGAYTGAAAHFSYVPSRGVGVAVLANGNVPPLTELAAAEAYDWAAGLASPDVSARLGQIVERMDRAPASDTLPHRPSRAPAAYTGRFAEPHWGDLAVERQGAGVAMRLGEYALPLVWSGPDDFVADGDTPGRYERDARGRAVAVWLKLTETDSVRFAR